MTLDVLVATLQSLAYRRRRRAAALSGNADRLFASDARAVVFDDGGLRAAALRESVTILEGEAARLEAAAPLLASHRAEIEGSVPHGR